MRYLSLGLISVSLFVICSLGFGCGGPAERIADRSTATPEPTSTPGEREISGVFNVEGAATHGVDSYNGILTIANQGDVHSYRWNTTKGNRVGTGVQMGNAAAASYAATGGGKGCGVVLYKISSDGSLEGRSVRWGEDKFGIERAVRTEGNGFVGSYQLSGTGPDGVAYSGPLTVKKDGGGYDFEWKTEKPQVGFAIWKGSVAAVGFGGVQCSFALYDVQSNGNLDGNWGGQKTVTFGVETAKRQ